MKLLSIAALWAFCCAAALPAVCAEETQTPARPPNIVFILADDLGYADLACQGAEHIRTPHLDRLANEGARFTSYYVAQAVCTASRAALLSGCYPNRVSMQGALNHTSRNGIHSAEWLLPEMLKDQGYATAGYGKWHLGTLARFGPLHNGFDEWLGIPYSNDNSKYHPVLAAEMPPLPFYDGEKIVEYDPDQSQFTRRFTERAVSFIEKNRDRPFFVYMPHVMPHVPIFASERFRGRSGHGLYADVVEELDWSVGEILSTLDRLKLAENTLVVFSSDNGPWLSYGDHAGSAKPLREGKLTVFEGGVRVPCLARWPGRIPRGHVSDDPFMAIDWLPTFAELCGGKMPSLKIDGRSVKRLLLGEKGAVSPHEALAFYAGAELHAIRAGDWKLHFPHPYLTTAGEPGRGGKPSNWGKGTPRNIDDSSIDAIASRHGQRVERLELSLFNLRLDPGETKNVARENQEIVERLKALAAPIRLELGDALTGVKGAALRPSGVEAAASARLPNIVFILADDLGYGDLGCYGQKRIQTPRIDRLAREGMRFTDFYAGSTVCAPSRCCLMTGYHTGHALIRGNSRENLRPTDLTVASLLQKAGYATGLVGKWGLGQEGSTGVPTRQGFDYFYGYLDQRHAHNYYPAFLMRNEERVPLKNVVPGPGEFGAGVATTKAEYSHDLMAAEALSFIDRNKDRPFFLYLALTIPHANNEAGKQGMEVPDLGPYKDLDWPEPNKGHAAMISRMDADVGRLLDRLKAHGLDERTLVFFTSDNGPHREGGHDPDFNDSNGPLRGIKRSLNEGGIRVPFIARWPGRVKAGSVASFAGAFWDVLPTLAELANVSDRVPQDTDGVSILPTLLGQGKQSPHDSLYWAFYEGGGGQALRSGEWKAVQQPYASPIRLYDLSADAGEANNLADEHPQVVARLAAQMARCYTPSENWKFPEPKPAK